MNNFTIFNFFTSATARLAKSKSYVVTLLFLLAFATNATAQNGNYTLNNADQAAYTTPVTDGSYKTTPFTARRNSKQQYIYYASEFNHNGNGLGTGQGNKEMKTMAYNIVTATPYHNIPGERHTFTNMKIRIANYTGSNFGYSRYDPFGEQFTLGVPNAVTGAIFEMDVPAFQVTELGWFTFDLIDNITGGGFIWDGNSNIIVEFSNSTPAAATTAMYNSKDERYGNHYGVEGTKRVGDSPVLTRVVSAYTYSRSLTNVGTLGRDMIEGGANDNVITSSPSNTETELINNRFFRPNVRFKALCGTYSDFPGTAEILSTELVNTKGCALMTLKVNGGNRAYGVTYEWQSCLTADFPFATTEILGTTEDIVVTQANVGKYYRRKSTTCTGQSRLSDPVYVPEASPNTFDGISWSSGIPDEYGNRQLNITAGTPTLNSNARACGCKVSAGANITVQSGVTLRVDGDLKVDGNLTVNNGASLLQLNPAATNTGNITVRRTTQPMVAYDYTYYGSPVQNATLESFSPNTLFDKYFKWNPGIQNWEGVVKTSVMAPGQGYIIRAPQGWTTSPAVFAGQFVGKPNNGTITTAIKTGATKMNMVVNPYPSPLDLDMFQAANSLKLDGTYYFWTHNTPINGTTLQYAQNDFAMYNGTGGTAATSGGTAPNGKVAIGQGFMVKGKGSVIADDTVIYSNDMRLPANVATNFYRQSTAISDVNASKSRYWLNFTGSTAFKQILVGYVNGASADYDNGFDGEISADASASFYSTLGDYQLGIQGRGLPFSSGDVVPLGFKVSSPGTYKIALNDFEGLFTQQNIYLVDKVANVTHNLKNGAYEFITTAGVHNERFEITYVSLSPQLNVATNGVSETANDFIAFKQANDLVIDAKGSQIDMIRVFDLSGRMLTEQKGKDASSVIIANPNWASQVLIVQMHTADKLVFTKKVVF